METAQHTKLYAPTRTTGDSDWHWRSVEYAARYYGRSPITIQHWCQSGTFAEFNIPVYKDVRGRFWICVPADKPVLL
jgi:hypothetical protein